MQNIVLPVLTEHLSWAQPLIKNNVFQCTDMLDIIQYGAWMKYGALERILLVAKLHKVVVYL